MPIQAPEGGIEFQAHVFVTVLGASNYAFACATSSEATADWIGSLCDALEFFGGVPELLVPDNPRALIAQPDHYELVLGSTTQDLVNHYGTAMLPARPGKSQDKPKVEVWVKSRRTLGVGPVAPSALLQLDRTEPRDRWADHGAERAAGACPYFCGRGVLKVVIPVPQ